MTTIFTFCLSTLKLFFFFSNFNTLQSFTKSRLSKIYFKKKMRITNIFHTPPWLSGIFVCWVIYHSLKGNLWQTFCGGWAEFKTGFWSSWATQVFIKHTCVGGISLFVKYYLVIVIVIFPIGSLTKRKTYSCYYSLNWNILPY